MELSAEETGPSSARNCRVDLPHCMELLFRFVCPGENTTVRYDSGDLCRSFRIFEAT